MDDIIQIEMQLPCDENGLVGRTCPECGGDFKVKFGTGLDTTQMYCPYCSYCTDSNDFLTEEQDKLRKSYAHRYIAEKFQNMLSETFGKHSNSRNSFVSISYKKGSLPSLYKYKEKELETSIICNNCGLNYAIYGVFANCPDCNSANQLDVLKKSIEVTRKKLNLINEIEEKDLIEDILKSSLFSVISSFDGFGKGFDKYNLPAFQRFYNLYLELSKQNLIDFKQFFGEDDFRFTVKMFQVRHIYEHNNGLIDDDFNAKTKLTMTIGRKYKLEFEEIDKMLTLIESLGVELYRILQ